MFKFNLKNIFKKVEKDPKEVWEGWKQHLREINPYAGELTIHSWLIQRDRWEEWGVENFIKPEDERYYQMYLDKAEENFWEALDLGNDVVSEVDDGIDDEVDWEDDWHYEWQARD